MLSLAKKMNMKAAYHALKYITAYIKYAKLLNMPISSPKRNMHR